MLEIEIKARIDNTENAKNIIRDRLKNMGAKALETENQKDSYFNHPSRDFGVTDEALRLRETNGKFIITYKGPKLDSITKTREEFNVGILDYGSMRDSLLRLGFKEVMGVEKVREHYEFGDFSIMLDNIKGLGDFVEVEKKGEAYEPEELVDFLKSIGIERDRIERKSYMELLMEKG